MATEPDQKKLQELSETYQKLQTDLQSTITTRQRLESQRQESTSVRTELSLLPSPSAPAQIYKLLGPVLLRQDRADANMAVEGRLDFIEREIKTAEGTIRRLQGEGERVKGEVVALQQQQQQG